ncbi:MAG: CHASE2 domain-containing protein, partial [Acidobacteria bacterium]|nr:CHASE2 domain-containing protein [Acidobacteriota bacterium]
RGEVEERGGALRVGQYLIAIHDDAEAASLPGVTVIRPNEMFINYLGPPQTFAYYSFADVLRGDIPAETFRGKIVLIGAVAQTMGDIRITPFISYGGASASGTGMPGVEVHANVIETIRRRAWLRPLADWLSFGLALLLLLASLVIIRLLDGWRVFLGLTTLLFIVIGGSLSVFNHYFIIPPLAPLLTGFFTVVPLLLLQGSINASRDLDRKLETLTQIEQSFLSHQSSAEDSDAAPLAFLASILRADEVALEKASLSNSNAPTPDTPTSLCVPLVHEDEAVGWLRIRRDGAEPFSESERRLAAQFAAALAAELSAARRGALLEQRALPISLPHNISWKLRAVDNVTAHLIARIGFMSRVLTSMTEGLLVSDLTGQVVFANPAAHAFWEVPEASALRGRSLEELFVARGIIEADGLRETMREVLEGRNVLLEVELLTSAGRFYTLQFSGVTASDTAPAPPRVIGLIVIINDITKRRELERVKAETMQLVSHELRTPLTSIQGLSDLLLKCPVPEEEAEEILGMIYSEAVRMNDLIKRYLDVTRIESGGHALTRKPVIINQLLAECARALGHLATEKRIALRLCLEEPSRTVFGDAQMLTQAISNLLSNAIKYSPHASQIELGTKSEGAQLSLYVRDEGYGIPPEARERVFEKFYRLERDAQSETVGTGLGLPLVKEIVERHGGHITLDSNNGHGSVFTIHLPLTK